MTDSAQPTIRQLIQSGTFIVAPGVFDGISARIADSMDFHAVYMTGYGTTASYLGLPDAGLSTYTDMVGRAGMIAGLCKTPLRSEEHTSELQSLMRISYAVFCLKKKK